MRTELTRLHQKLATTFIYVTHDQIEAMTMGTRIVVMKDGFVQQIAPPQELYNTPCNLFVAGFIGSPQMNTVEVTLEDKGGVTYAKFGKFSLALPESKGRKEEVMKYIGKQVILGIRPENLRDEEIYLTQFPDSTAKMTVDVVEMMGAETYLYMTCEDNAFVARVSPRNTTQVGDEITVAFEAHKIHLFDMETEQTITS
jgi:multiple sugar transport system ATP-binding protein